MYTQEDLYWVWLCSQEGIGPAKRRALLEQCGTIAGIYEASGKMYREAGLDEAQAAQLENSKRLEEYQERCQIWNEQGIQIMSRDRPEYPASLKNVCPQVDLLFLKGNVQLLYSKSISIVGSRKCTSYGAGAARYFAKGLGGAGYTIVSGLASGIDACAHRGALEDHKNTIAVLGCGIDICYPKNNLQLYQRIERYGLIVSEYFPGTPPQPAFFPMRNRIIAALSRAVVVVEAAEKSGALITADQALEAGVDVFAVPGSIFDASSRGTNHLIQQGAYLVCDWRDILQTLGDTEAEPVLHRFRDPDLQKLWESIGWTAQDLQTLITRTAIGPEKFMQCLTALEMAGYAEREAGGVVRKKE